MKKSIKSSARKVLVALLFSILSFFGYSQDSESLNVIVYDFWQDTTLSLGDTTINITPLLSDYLDANSHIKVFSEIDDFRPQLDSLSNGLSPKNLANVDVVVNGWYEVDARYMRVSPLVYLVSEQMLYPVNLTRGSLSNIAGLTGEVADNLIEKFIEISPKMRYSFKSIAIVGDYQQLTGAMRNITEMKNTAQDIRRQIVQELEYMELDNTEIIPWKEVVKYVNVHPAEVIKDLKPDMYLRLNFFFDNEQFVNVKMDFLLPEQGGNREFNLPELSTRYYSEFEFTSFVTNELTWFLDRIVDENGQFDFQPFPNSTSRMPASVNIVLANAEKKLADNDFYLSNYYYYQALIDFSTSVSSEDVRLRLGLNKVYMYRLEEANEEFEFVLAENPQNGLAYVGKSVIYYYNANYDSAKITLDQASAIGLDDGYLYNALTGYYCFALNKYDEALDYFQKAINQKRSKIRIKVGDDISPLDIRIHIGLCYIGKNEFEEAVDHYIDLKGEYRGNEDILYYLGNAYSKKGIQEFLDENYSLAIQDFKNAQKTYPNSNINDYLRLSLNYEFRFDEASQFIEQEIAAGNYNQNYIWKMQAMDIRSMMIDKAKDKDDLLFDTIIGQEVIESLKKGLQPADNDPTILYRIGEMNTLLGQVDSGLIYMEKAFEEDAFNFNIQLGYLQSLLLTGNFKECSSVYNRKLPRVNKKSEVDPRTEAIMDFLYISASFNEGKKAKKEIKSLNKLLNDGTIIDRWIFNPYTIWLNQCACSDETKTTLSDLLTQMQNSNPK